MDDRCVTPKVNFSWATVGAARRARATGLRLKSSKIFCAIGASRRHQAASCAKVQRHWKRSTKKSPRISPSYRQRTTARVHFRERHVGPGRRTDRRASAGAASAALLASPDADGLAMSLNLDIDSLPPEKVEAAITRLEAVKAQRAAENKLSHYRPYPKQAAFHEAGAKHRERLFMCANRFGKTTGGAAELTFHLTGDYPEWWHGKRFDKPVRAWAAGVTGETTRDVLQEKLIGPPFRESEWGTGMIPKAAIAGVATSRGIPAGIDTVNVRHISGGLSSLQFKSYERGRE